MYHFTIGQQIQQAHAAYTQYDFHYGRNRFLYCHAGPLVCYKRRGVSKWYFKRVK